MAETIRARWVSRGVGVLLGAAALSCAALAGGCRARPAALDPWKTTPLEEAAIRCDHAELRDVLATMRRYRLAPNLRDLHDPDGSLARLARGCEPGLLNPALASGDIEILRAALDLAGFEATPESALGTMFFAKNDPTSVVLPKTRTRSGIRNRMAIVSIDESGFIRVSSGEELTVPVVNEEDVLSFALGVMATSTEPPGRPDQVDRGIPVLRLVVGPADELQIGDKRAPAQLDAIGSAVGRLRSAGALVIAPEVELTIDPHATYGWTVAVLDELAAAGTTPPIAVRSEGGTELVLEAGAAPAGTSAFAVKADRSLSFSAVAGVLHALARAGAKRLILLSSLDLQQPSGPKPGTYPGGLPGGLELIVRGLRNGQRPASAEARRPDPPRVVEMPPAEAATLPEADIVFEEPPAPDPGDALMVGGEVHPPVKLYAPPPLYTEIARKARIQGVVILQTVIDRHGDVSNIEVLKGLPMGLEAQAVEAVRQWKFEPATLNGEPVAVYYNLTVNFHLE